MVKRVFVLISLVVAILVIGGNAFAQDKTPEGSIPNSSLGPEWKFVGIGSRGTAYYVNTRSIAYFPKGIVGVWVLSVPRGKLRRFLVYILKLTLSLQGKDPNIAERYWYDKSLYKINCRTHQYASVEMIEYSFEKTVLHSIFPNAKEWGNIPPGTAIDKIEKYVCKETPPSIPAQYKQSIPEPPLSSEWKLVATVSDGTTVYFNTRKIIYLPKGIVKVWELVVPRGEFRRGQVHLLKKIFLFEGKDPNNAERLWYHIQLDKVDCKTHQVTYPEETDYSFGQTVLFSHSVQHEKWDNIIPGSVMESVEKFVCKSTK